MTDLLSLAERVERATGPDQELGREVLLACGWRKSGRGYFLGPLFGWSSPDGKTYFDDDDFRRHDPTASIDAAMMLGSTLPKSALVEAFRSALNRWVDQSCDAKAFARFLAAELLRAIAAQSEVLKHD